MIPLLKALLLLFLELNLFFIAGTFLGRLSFVPSLKGAADAVLYGFIAYHFLFWCAAYLCKCLHFPFHIVYYFWLAVLLIVPAAAAVLLYKDTASAYLGAFRGIKDNVLYAALLLIPVAALLVYTVTHGQVDVDSYTYISEIGTFLHTDSLSGFAAATGKPQTNAGAELRRGFALFGAESACWCRLFGLKAVAYCRYVRSSLNVIFLAASLFSCARIWRPLRESCLFTAASLSFVPLFAGTIYQPGAFLLTRGYEGKAWLAGTLIVLTAYFGARCCTEKSAGTFILLFMANIACLNISASAVYVIPPVLAVFMCTRLISRRQIRDLLLSGMVLLPNLYFILQFAAK